MFYTISVYFSYLNSFSIFPEFTALILAATILNKADTFNYCSLCNN